MSKNAFISYPPTPGKNARLAADKASRGDAEGAFKRVHLASADLELMHPSLWGVWVLAPDDIFERAVESLREAEAVRLTAAFDGGGRGIGAVFIESSVRKLAALARAGVPMSRSAGASVGEWRPELACWAAWVGSMQGLLLLARAGVEPPVSFSASEAKLAGLPGARCALHLLALAPVGRERRWSLAEAQEVVPWIARGTSLYLRGGEGRDALGMAIDAANPRMVQVLLQAGLDPRRVDGKGRDAIALLKRREEALRQQHFTGKADELRAQIPAIVSSMERAILTAMNTEPAPGSRPRTLSL